MHPDSRRELKLALLLFATSALIVAGNPRAFAPYLFDERIGLSRFNFSLVFTLSSLAGGLLLIGTAIWIDRRGPHPVMALGAIATAVGALILIPAGNLPAMGIGLLTAAVGGAGTASLIFYAAAARSATRHRGALFGIVAAVFIARIPIATSETVRSSNMSTSLLVAAAFCLTAAYLLYRFLPRLTPAPESPALNPNATDRAKLIDQPGFWRSALFLGFLFTVALAIGSTALSYMPLILGSRVDFLPLDDLLLTLRITTAIGALAWALASDRFPTHRLLIVAALIAVPATAVAWLIDTPAVALPADAILAFVSGGLLILPWMLLAEHFPARHFAKLGLIITIPSTVLSSLLGPLAAGLTMDHWGLEGPAIVLMALSLIAATLAWRFPRPAPVPQPAD